MSSRQIVLYDKECELDRKHHRSTIVEFFKTEESYDRLMIEMSCKDRKGLTAEAFNTVLDQEMTYLGDYERDCLKELYTNESIGLSSHITLGLSYENRFIGTGHRRLTQQKITVSDTESTPGYIETVIEPGVWQLHIHCHRTYAPVYVSIRVLGEKDGI